MTFVPLKKNIRHGKAGYMDMYSRWEELHAVYPSLVVVFVEAGGCVSFHPLMQIEGRVKVDRRCDRRGRQWVEFDEGMLVDVIMRVGDAVLVVRMEKAG